MLPNPWKGPTMTFSQLRFSVDILVVLILTWTLWFKAPAVVGWLVGRGYFWGTVLWALCIHTLWQLFHLPFHEMALIADIFFLPMAALWKWRKKPLYTFLGHRIDSKGGFGEEPVKQVG